MDCLYCHKTYSSSYALSKHQKTTKSCIKIQQENGKIPDIMINKFECVYCHKRLTTHINLKYHLTCCKKKNSNNEVDKELTETKLELEKTKLELEKTKLELEKREKSPVKITNKINNNTVNNIEQQNITIYNIMTPDVVEEFFKKHYNLDTLLGGQKALAQFVNEGFLTKAPVYVCGDRSRQKFYIMKDGKKVEDTDCNEILKLTTPGLPSVKQVYSDALFTEFPEEVTEDDIQDNYKDICSMSHDRNGFKQELSKIAPSSEVIEPNTDVKKAFMDLESAILPNESRRKKESIETEPVRKDDVLGFSRGALMMYQQRFKKDGTVNGPKSIMEQFVNEGTRNEYMAFLES
jgi:hypothetical protein